MDRQISLAPQKEAPSQRESLGRKFVEVNGREWAYLEYGNPEGIPILILHGWMASPKGDIPLLRAFAGDMPESYGFKMLKANQDSARATVLDRGDRFIPSADHTLARNVEELKGKYRVVDPYQPGTSETKPLDNISYDTMADEVAAFQKALGIESSIVFGSSGGGIVGTKLAAHHPEAVKVLVLQGTPTRKEDLQKRPYYLSKALTFGPIPYILFNLHLAYPIFSLQAMTSKEFRWRSEESQKAMLEAFRTGDGRTATKLLREILGENIEKDIDKVQCPVIVVDGINGQLVPFVKEKEAAGKFHRYIPPAAERATRTDEGVLLAVSEAFGKQGHTVVDTSPEVLAVLTDKMSTRLLKERS